MNISIRHVEASAVRVVTPQEAALRRQRMGFLSPDQQQVQIMRDIRERESAAATEYAKQKENARLRKAEEKRLVAQELHARAYRAALSQRDNERGREVSGMVAAPASPSERIAAAHIVESAAEFGIPVDRFFDRCAVKGYTEARQRAIWLIRRDTDWSLPKIGRFFSRDHATIQHAIDRESRRRGGRPRS